MPRMCLCLVSVFRRRIVFKLLNPKVHSRSYRKWPEKIVFFLEKRPLNAEKIQNFAMKGFAGTRIHAFLPSFAEIGKAKVTKRGAWHSSQKVAILIVSLGLLERSRQKILQDHSFPIPHPSAKFHPNPSTFQGYKSENVFQTHYNISVKPATNTHSSCDHCNR